VAASRCASGQSGTAQPALIARDRQSQRPLGRTWWQGSRSFGRRGQTRCLVTVATGGRSLAHSISFSTWRSYTKTDSALHHPAAIRSRSLAPRVRQSYGRPDLGPWRIDDASRPVGASRKHDTYQLHALAPGLLGQTIERAGGYKQDATRTCRCQASVGRTWITVRACLNIDSPPVSSSGGSRLPLCPLW
jgi:hypothetical protein